VAALPLRSGPAAREIQGNVLAAFNKPHMRFVLVTFAVDDRAAARAWLREMFPLVSCSEDVASHNDAWKLDNTLEELWTALGLTRSGLERLGVDSVDTDLSAHRAFRVGPARRAGDLGDVDASAPSNWLFGASEVPVDAVVTVAGDVADAVCDRVKDVERIAAARGARVLHAPAGRKLPDGREHFGFRDGIGQPDVKGFVAAGIEPGEFLLGWPDERGEPGELAPWLHNASFQVLRVLAQDVAGWEAAAAEEADPGRWSAERMGRTPSGELLDPTPPGSHIRKVVPAGYAFGSRRRRLLRRGIPYGRPFAEQPDAPRGLLFNAFMANIGSQYEYVQAFFANSASFPTPGTGPDPVIGGPDASQAIYRDRRAAPAWPRFVTTRGAAYAIALSLPALKELAAGR